MDEAPSGTVSKPASASTFSWLLACFVVTIALSLVAAHAPPRIRLIGLFAIAFGLVIGWITMRMAAILDFRPSIALAGVVAGCLSLGGLVGSTWEIWRLDDSRNRESSKDRLAALVIDQMKTDPTSAATIPIASTPLTEFRSYLSRRIRQLGHWSSPWPEIIWGLELTLGTFAGTITAVRSLTLNRTPVASQSMKSTTT